MLEESCKQARRAYFLVATVCVAIGLFALTASPPDDLYRRAHAQVGAALAIDWPAYDDFVRDRLNDFSQQRYVDNRNDFYGYVTLDRNDGYRLTRLSPYELVHETVPLDALYERLMRGSPYRVFGGGMDGVRFAEIGYLVYHHHAVYAATFAGYQAARGDDRAPYELTPVDVVRLVKSPVGTADASIVTPDPEAVADTVYRKARSSAIQVARGSPARPMVAGVAVDGHAELTDTGMVDLAVPDAALPKVRLELNIETLPLKAFDESMGINRSQQGWRAREDVEELRAAVIEVPGTSMAAWLAQAWPALGSVRDGALEPFAGLRHVWPTIADRPLLDADLYLAAALSKEEASAPRVSLGGVELPAALVPVGGPLVVALLLVQLARLLGFMVRRAPGQAQGLRELPWLVLHARQGVWEAAAVVLALPLAAQTLVAWRALSTGDAVLTAGWSLTAVAMAAGVVTVIRISRLQRLVEANTATGT